MRAVDFRELKDTLGSAIVDGRAPSAQLAIFLALMLLK
jgi:hypothetical protein